tara:strand:+ start:1847 stop:3847 length:2001 start_codon:yes stop_codon:yes gene_type:complete
MANIFGEQESDFERAISQYRNNANSVAQGALGGYASVAQGKQSLAESGYTAESTIDLDAIQAQVTEEGTKFMKEMGLDFSTPGAIKGTGKILDWAGGKLTEYSKASRLPMAEYRGPNDMRPMGVGKKGMRSEVDPETGKPIDVYDPGRVRGTQDTNPGDAVPESEGGAPPTSAPDVTAEPVGDLPPVRTGTGGAPDVTAQPVGDPAPPAPTQAPDVDVPAPAPDVDVPGPTASADPNLIPKTGATDPAPQSGTFNEQLSEQFRRIRGGDVPEGSEVANAMNEGRVARTPGQIDEYNQSVQDYNTANNPLAESTPDVPAPDVPAPAAPEPAVPAPAAPRGRQAEVPDDADFGETPGWQMTEPSSQYTSSTEMTGNFGKDPVPQNFETTQVSQPGQMEAGPQTAEIGDIQGNFTGATRSLTGQTITRKVARPEGEDDASAAADYEPGTEGSYRLPTTEWEGPIPEPAIPASSLPAPAGNTPAAPTPTQPASTPAGGAADPAASSASTDISKTIAQETSSAADDASKLASDAANTSSEVSSEVSQVVPEVSEETSTIASTLADYGGSMLSTVGGFLGDVLPFLAPIMAGYGMYSGIKDMDKQYGSEGDDPYAKVRGELQAGQEKVGAMGAQISADQFASKVGGAAPAFGSLAAPTFSTAQQLGGATGHF